MKQSEKNVNLTLRKWAHIPLSEILPRPGPGPGHIEHVGQVQASAEVVEVRAQVVAEEDHVDGEAKLVPM